MDLPGVVMTTVNVHAGEEELTKAGIVVRVKDKAMILQQILVSPPVAAVVVVAAVEGVALQEDTIRLNVKRPANQ